MATSDLDRVRKLLAAPQPIRWVFAGDSITHGALHTMGWRDYVELFSERVRWEMQRVRDCVIKTGVSGWKATSIQDDLEWSVLQYRPEVVSINVGMNDCAAGVGAREEFERVYARVVARIRESGAAVLLHTPNRILPADTLRAPSLSEYACAAREISEKTGAVLIDHFAAWEAWEKNGWLAYLLSDAIHPNECGHRLMNRTLLSALGMWDDQSLTGRMLIPSPR